MIMKTVSISGSIRKNVGKKDAKKMRAEGQIPCVVYGGKEQKHFTLNEIEVLKLVETNKVHFVEIDLNGEKTKTMIQEAQYHPVTDKPLHFDFLEIIDGKKIKMEIPIKLTGSSPGLIKGGRLVTGMRKLVLKALPENMPDVITIDITELDIMDSIKVKDLKLENVEIFNKPAELVVGIRTARAVEEEVEEGEGEEGEEGAEGTEGAEGKEGAEGTKTAEAGGEAKKEEHKKE